MRKANDTELAGIAMPAILKTLRAMLVGETIIDITYMVDDEGQAWPTIITDDHHLVIQRDDEANGPGAVHVSGYDPDGQAWSQIMPTATMKAD